MRSPRALLPLAGAAALLLGGYVPLLLLWGYGSHPAGLPGLFDYRSATWGDGLLLPLLALCLGRLMVDLPKVSTRWPTIIAVIMGAGAGGLVIVTWLTDPAPSVNWTMPRPHRLNLPGVWHAIFLVMAAALFAGMWVELLRRLRSARRDQAGTSLRSTAAVGAIASTTGYAWLSAVDSGRAAGTTAGRGSLVALGLATLVFMGSLVWAGRRALRAGVSTAVTGLLVAVVIVMFATIHGHADALVYWALVGSVGAGLALASSSGHPGRFSRHEMVSVLALFAGLTLLVVGSNVDLVVVVLVPFAAVFCSALLRLFLRRAGSDAPRDLTVDYLASAGISASLLAACVFGLWLSEHGNRAYITGGFLLTIVGAVLGGLFLPYFKADFEQLMRVEGDPAIRQSNGRPGQEQARAAAAAWPRVGGYAVSAFASMLVLTIALAPSLGWKAGHAPLDWAPVRLAAIAVVILLAPAIGALPQAVKRHPPVGPRRFPTGASGPAWWCLLAGLGACVALSAGLLRDRSVQPLAIIQAVLITAFALNGILGNAAWLNLGRIRWPCRAAVAAVTLAVLMAVYWSVTGAIRPGGGPAPSGATILGWLMAALLVAVLVELTAAAVYVAGGRPYLTDYPPANNVIQDLFHLLLLWFVLGWLPQFVLANVPASASERWAAIGTILAGFLLLFGPAFLWILENNDTHVERQRRIKRIPAAGVLAQLSDASSSADRIGTLPSRIAELGRSVRHPNAQSTSSAESEEFLVRLSGHTAVQNTLALMLATVSAIGLIGISAGLAPSATGLSSLPEVE